MAHSGGIEIVFRRKRQMLPLWFAHESLSQADGRRKGLRSNFRYLIKHGEGLHDCCFDGFCNFLENPRGKKRGLTGVFMGVDFVW